VSTESSLCVHTEFIMCPQRVHYVSTQSSLCVHREFIMCPHRVHCVSTESSLCVHREFIMCPQRVYHVSTESSLCVHSEFIMCPKFLMAHQVLHVFLHAGIKLSRLESKMAWHAELTTSPIISTGQIQVGHDLSTKVWWRTIILKAHV